MDISGLPSPDSEPTSDTILIVDRLQRLSSISTYFNQWKTYVDQVPDLTKTQRSKMFLTHWLFNDLQKTCHSMVEVVNKYVKGSDRVWVPRRFNQDPIESLFDQLRNNAGSNTNMDRTAVDVGMTQIRVKRSLHLPKTDTYI